MAKTSKAKIKANRKWNEENYYRIALTIPKTWEKEIKEYATNNNTTINKLLNTYISGILGKNNSTNTSVSNDTNTSVSNDTNTSVLNDTNTSVLNDTNTSVLNDTNTSVLNDPNTSVLINIKEALELLHKTYNKKPSIRTFNRAIKNGKLKIVCKKDGKNLFSLDNIINWDCKG